MRRSTVRRLRLLPVALLLACGDSPSDPGGGSGTVVINGPATLSFEYVGQQTMVSATSSTGEPIRWNTSLAPVATVQDGLITARGDGSAYIIASAGGDADSVQVTVSQVATALAFVSPPGGAVRGEPFPDPVRVAVVDAGGSPVLSFTGAISISLEGGGGVASLQGTLTRSVVGGIAFFDDLSIDAAGSGFRLTAVAGGSLTGESTPFDIVEAADLVVARNIAVSELGVLIDGATAAGDFNDLGRVVLDSVVQVVALPGEWNDVIAFSRGRPPMLVEATWTQGVDTVEVAFPDPLAIPVTVWVIKGPYGEQRARAANAIATTSLIWDEERMGLDFAEVEYVDATGVPGAEAFYDLTLCNQQAQITSTIGRRAGRINIYYVGRVDGGTDRGRACAGGDFTIMAERSGHELLSHEIGHLFTLGHVDADSRFNRTNVMHSASNTRRYLTEGQVFRQHYHPATALRSVYGLRDDPAVTCGSIEACPSIARRLWADGEFPANDEVAAVNDWLLRTCITGMSGEEIALKGAGGAAVELLRDAARAGPPESMLREVARAESERASAIRARLAAGETFGLDPQARAELAASLDDSADRRADEVARSWTEAAVRGLRAIGTTPAIGALRELADAADPDLAAAARRALRR